MKSNVVLGLLSQQMAVFDAQESSQVSHQQTTKIPVACSSHLHRDTMETDEPSALFGTSPASVLTSFSSDEDLVSLGIDDREMASPSPVLLDGITDRLMGELATEFSIFNRYRDELQDWVSRAAPGELRAEAASVIEQFIWDLQCATGQMNKGMAVEHKAFNILELSDFSLTALPAFLLPFVNIFRGKVGLVLCGNQFSASQPTFEI